MTTLRRQVKNMVKNYSEAEVKVREATSNDPWGPSSTLMSEISDLTYNIVALGEVMRMIWKRLNDHGKNWRHVYKSLVLLDYLIKNGNEKVAQQCKEHIVAIQTLKDFQYMEEQKDQGASVREKAKQLVNLLRDDERLKQERAKAFKARERFAQNAMGISSDNKLTFASGNLHGKSAGYTGTSSKTSGNYADPYGGAAGNSSLNPELEAVRPSDANEEDLQIKLAIMLSQQEHEEELQKKRADEAKLQIALEQSKTEGQPNGLVDLGDSSAFGSDPWSSNANNSATKPVSDTDSDDFFPPLSSLSKSNAPAQVDPWASVSLPPPAAAKQANNGSLFPSLNTATPNTLMNPWSSSSNTSTNTNSSNSPLNLNKDPWSSSATNNTNAISTKLDDFDLFTTNRATSVASPTNIKSNDLLSDPFGDFFGSSNTNTTTSTSNITNNNSDLFSQHNSTNPWNSSNTINPTTNTNSTKPINPTRKTPDDFLGENSSLVNLENLIPTTTTTTTLTQRPKSTNPFGTNTTPAPPLSAIPTSNSSTQLNNPFMSQQQLMNPKGPSINQLQNQSAFPSFANTNTVTAPMTTTPFGGLAQPLIAQPPIMPSLFNQPLNQTSLFSTAMTPATNNNAAAATNPFLMM